jgi:capsular exopolysaccharide synthesis family protein
MLESSDNTIHLREYFKVIRNRLWIIFTIFLLTVVSGIYVTEQVLPRIYTASAQIQIQPRDQTTVQAFQNTSNRPFDMTFFQSEMEIMQSSDVLSPIISDLGLDKIWAKRDFKSSVDVLSAPLALDYMHKKILHVDFKHGTDIVQISADSQDAKEASDIANAVVDRYKMLRDIELSKRSGSGEDTLRQEIARQQSLVNEKKGIVDKLRLQMGDAAPGTMDQEGQSSRDEQLLDQRQKDLLSAKEEANSRQVLMDQVKNLSDDEFVNTLAALGREESNITSLRTNAFKLESDIANLLKEGFEDNHPRVQSVKAELNSTREQIAEVIAGMRRAIVVEAQMAKSRVDLLNQEVEVLKKKSSDEQANQLSPYRDALHEYQRQVSILDSYNMHLKQVVIDSQLMDSPVNIVSRATPPNSPSKPIVSLYVGLSVAAGLFFGIIVAFLIEYLDTSVKTMADAEQLLGLPVLSVIPNKGGPMPVTQQAARLPHAEGYRILRAKLDLKVQNGIGPSLSVLSGGPGEGKSTTLFNLGIVCAQTGQSVIMVDCDLRRPTLHQLFKISNDRGLANYLRGEGDAVEYIQPTAIPSLHILPAGDMPISEIGVLAGDKIRHMLDDLKQRYDLVLIDSPPILGISDGSIIAREVDYVILVVQHRRYPREISLRAKRAVEEVHGNCIGMVLNSVTVKSDDSYYYYSNYGNYYKKTDRKDKKQRSALKIEKAAMASNGHHQDIDSEEF